MINRPPRKIPANCYFKFYNQLMFVCAKKNINTNDKWIELYIAYNNKHV